MRRVAVVLLAATWLASASAAYTQEEFAEPIGEEDSPVGGPMVYGQDVGSAPIGGPAVYGEDVGSAPIGGPMVGGAPVGSAPIDGPMIGGDAVQEGGEGAPIDGDTLY
jgi:hypothetical protein